MSSLSTYVKKRDFALTREPRGAPKKGRGGSSFVIQKHDASRLHYDFRLEMDGTLKSWALPKGVPWKRGEKHLAVQVEDHPLEYAAFEGIIPEGQYGGGTVMVWDTGTYECFSVAPQKALAEGKLHLALHGKKLEGEWTLVRLSRGDGNEWLIIKSGEDLRPLSKKRDDESGASGRTMAQIARERTSEWRSGGAHGKMEFIEPMKATLVAEPPTHGDWLYELKFDGYRALALKNGQDVQLLSRNNKDFAKKFPEIVEAVQRLPVERAALDGEIVATDEAGRSSFRLLQALEMSKERPPLSYYIFDLLDHDGASLLDLPLDKRRAQLKRLLKGIKPPLFFSADLQGEPQQLLDAVRAQGMEGIIGKERKSPYVPGQRSRSWIKLKCVGEQELVIGGYTDPEGTRKHFGALLVGYYEGHEFRFAGKVGTGFNGASLKALHQQMRKLAQNDCPFANLPEREQGRWHQNITPREMKLCHWVKPQLVCQVRYTEWTNDGKLRHPVFAGLREDKAAREVSRERPVKTLASKKSPRRAKSASPTKGPRTPQRARKKKASAKKAHPQSMSKTAELEVAGRTLTVSNLQKVLYPEAGFTKGQVIDYYIRIAPVLLPHLKKRPITLKRYPDGVNGFFFYEKQCPAHRPDWVKTAKVPSERREFIDYCLMDDLPALVWAANLADLELHTFLHRAPAITRPTALAFDLDPGPPADIVLCCQVGLWLREVFSGLGLESFPKTSGSKGLQIFVPLNTATNYDKTKAFAHALAERLERDHPKQIVSRMQKSLRKGKVLIDWSQNDDHKTTINVYSLRARPQPTVSTPVTWDEVAACLKKKKAAALVFTSEDVLRRAEKLGDLFAPVLTLKQKLPALAKIENA